MAENESAPASDHRGETSNASRSSAHKHDTAERPFVHQWRSAVFNSSLSPVARVTLLALAEFAESDGTRCYPAIMSIAMIAGVNEKTARRVLASAEQEGWVAREHKGQGHDWRHYEYRLLLPEGADTTPARQAVKRADSAPAALSQGADTTPARQDETCGLSRPNVRTLTPERAGRTPDEIGFRSGFEIGEAKNALTSAESVWQKGIDLLTGRAGKSKDKARSIIGRLRKNLHNDDAKLLDLITRAEVEAADPVSWLMEHSKPVDASRPRSVSERVAWLCAEQEAQERANAARLVNPKRPAGGTFSRPTEEESIADADRALSLLGGAP